MTFSLMTRLSSSRTCTGRDGKSAYCDVCPDYNMTLNDADDSVDGGEEIISKDVQNTFFCCLEDITWHTKNIVFHYSKNCTWRQGERTVSLQWYRTRLERVFQRQFWWRPEVNSSTDFSFEEERVVRAILRTGCSRTRFQFRPSHDVTQISHFRVLQLASYNDHTYTNWTNRTKQEQQRLSINSTVSHARGSWRGSWTDDIESLRYVVRQNVSFLSLIRPDLSYPIRTSEVNCIQGRRRVLLWDTTMSLDEWKRKKKGEDSERRGPDLQTERERFFSRLCHSAEDVVSESQTSFLMIFFHDVLAVISL